MKSSPQHIHQAGFTLIEMMIATTVFVVISVSALSSMLSLLDAAHSARQKYAMLDSLNLTIENMVRLMRTGSTYHCNVSQGDPYTPRDCTFPGNGANSIAFADQDGRHMRFNISSANRIQQSINAAVYRPITAEGVFIDRLQFYVTGSASDDTEQPYVTIVIHGYFTDGSASPPEFGLQTGVTQQAIDS